MQINQEFFGGSITVRKFHAIHDRLEKERRSLDYVSNPWQIRILVGENLETMTYELAALYTDSPRWLQVHHYFHSTRKVANPNPNL